MSYYPREIVDCYLEKKFEELLNVPGADAVYVASVAKDESKDLFYIERGIAIDGQDTSAFRVPIKENQDLKDCINKYNNKNDDSLYFPPEIRAKDIVQNKKVGKFSLQATKRKIRPAAGGCSIGHHKSDGESGTLGAILQIESPLSNKKYIISNYHVMSNEKLENDNLIFQPSPGFTGGFNYENVIARLKFGHFGDYVDVAFAEVLNDDDVQGGFIWDSVISVAERKINGLGKPFIGQGVHKHGTTSHTTNGVIRSLNTYVKFPNPWKSSQKEIFKKQILTCNMSSKGDSGSILLNEKREAVGLVIGGDDQTFSICNNFSYIFNTEYQDMPNLTFKKFI